MRTIGRLLSDAVARSPDAPYLIAGDDEYSFQAVGERSAAAALALWGSGISRGDRVAVIVEADPSFLFTWFGLSLMGATLIPLDPSATVAETAGLLQRISPRSVIVDEAHLGKARDAVEEARLGCDVVTMVDVTPSGPVSTTEDFATPGDVALMLPTSGTTSASKLVMQTHSSMVLAGEGFPWWIGLRSSDRLLAALPLFHLNALAYSALGSLSIGASLVLLPRFSASRFLSQARYYGGTQFNAVGALLEILMRQPERSNDDMNPLRLCYAAPAPATRQRHLQIERRFGFEITAGYALSETPYGTIWPPDAEGRPYGSLGRLRQHPEHGEINEGKVVDEGGREVSPGETGELCLRNPAVMAGYFGMAAETAEVLHDGWLRTGDLVRRDPGGLFHFVARKKELIRRRGENVAPGEIEAALTVDPSVIEAAVVGVPSELGEEEIKAFLVAPDADPVAVVTALAGRLSKHKLPRYVEVLADLPRTPTGRVAKHRLPRGRNDRELDLG